MEMLRNGIAWVRDKIANHPKMSWFLIGLFLGWSEWTLWLLGGIAVVIVLGLLALQFTKDR